MGKRTHGPYLIAAIEYGDIEKVSHILSTKFRDKSKVKTFLTSEVRRLASEYSEVPLLLAATLDDPAIIRYFVTKHETNINFVYEYGHQGQRRRKTALLIAVRRGLYATVEAILQMNGDVNMADHKGRTSLHHAVRRADYRMAKLLLSRGAQAICVDIAGNTPLHVAAIFGHTEMCRLLLKYGADLYKRGQHGAIPIHIAAKEGHASLVRMFITLYEVNVDIRVPCYDNEREQAPIHVAAAEGHYETVYTLLDACSADVNLRDSEGETPLHCAVIRECDPLGMKSKDDFTETVKVLLNFGAEATVRNGRGETPLHLAARNELQKAVEVLVLAGCDPLVEDNDRNKAIDLVAADDAVSRQTLKTAMADRERIMSEAREIRARGFTTGLQRELPISARSQSTLNIPLAGTLASAVNASRYMSHTGIYQPPGHVGVVGGGGYLPGFAYGNNNNRSGSRTSSSTNSSKRRSEIATSAGVAAPRLPGSMLNTSAGAIAPQPLSAGVGGLPPHVGAMRKARSVEELDQPRSGQLDENDARAAASRKGKRRVRKGSYQESEASSFWAVTPPGSFRGESDLDVELPIVKATKKGKAGAGLMGRDKKLRLKESDEELEEEPEVDKKKKTGKKNQPQAPLKFEQPKKRADLDQSEEYYLDDDDDATSVDTLAVEVKPASKKRAKPLPAVPPAKNAPSTKKGGGGVLDSWLDEQARLLKERNKTDGPVAHSTPPATTKRGKPQHHPTKAAAPPAAEVSDDDDDDSSSETSSCSESSDPDAPKCPPPPPPGAKPKPAPPPKPSKKPAGARPTPLFQMDNPNVNQVIQLDVDESQPSAQTVISIIPVNPPGPTRVQKIPHGSSSSTYVNLGKGEPPQTTKKSSKDAGGSAPKPVPRPRESKMAATGAAASNGRVQQPAAHAQKQKPNAKDLTESSSESSTDFSSGEEEEEQVAAVPVSPPPKSARPGNTPTKPTIQPIAAKPLPQPPAVAANKKPLTTQTSRSGLVFEKATVPDATDGGGDFPPTLKSSYADLTTAAAPPTARARKSSESELLSASPGGARPQPLLNSSNASSDKSSGRGAVKPTVVEPSKPKTAVPAAQVQPANRHAQPKPTVDQEDGTSSEEDDDDDEEEDEEESDHDAKAPKAHLKTVVYTPDAQNLGFTLVGGNAKGVFVHTIDPTSDAARRGLAVGDQLIRLNDSLLIGKTREEVVQLLRGATGSATLHVSPKPVLCRSVADTDGGAGDAFFVRAHFSTESTKKGELSVFDGDVFAVMDTLPDGVTGGGCWRARKVESGRKKDADGSVGVGAVGLIPNRTRADQIVVKQNLASGKPAAGGAAANERGGLFFRSFRRSKSATRTGGGRGSTGDDEENKRLSTSSVDIVSYERVSQKISDTRRPVVVLGLFCDTVRTMLIRDSPDRFVAPSDEVETPNGPVPVDVRPIMSVGGHQHCLLILSPPGIEYLLQATDLNPISVYLSPVSKNIVKVVRAKLAPNYNKNTGFMYDEASRFERNYAHLFNAVIPYTVDDTWFFNLKDLIEMQQNLPTWVGLSQADVDAAAVAEATRLFPGAAAAKGQATSRQGRSTTTAASRMSRTTDDLPHEYRTTAPEVGATATAATSGTTSAAASGRRFATKDGRGTAQAPGPAAAAPLQAVGLTGNASGVGASAPPGGGKTVAKARTLSIASTLDQSSDRNQFQANRPRVAAGGASHETQL